ncbi:MAG TPA: hypothetical protein PKD83_08445 [Ignavibacteria bacterium]|nr:hypothetical protein [Ignavibacteria bacterium]
MKWSKLKKTIEDKFAESVKGRVCLFVTRYTTGSYFMVRGWITIDKVEIANFSTPDNADKYGWNTPEINERIPDGDRTIDLAVEKGEFSRHDFLNACWDYLNININDALKSENPIIRSFAVLDKRTGKRRLDLIKKENLHPLVLKLLMFRLNCDKKYKYSN